MNEEQQTIAYQAKGLSWGALGLTPLWLFRNGFWLTAIVVGYCWYAFWPAALLIGLLFFIKGAEWSWGKGDRWCSVDDFEDSMAVWNILGMIVIALNVIVFITLFWFYGSIGLGLRELF